MIKVSAQGMQPVEIDGLIATMVLALILKRKAILSSPTCQITFDVATANRGGPGVNRGIKLRVSPMWREEDLGLPKDMAS